MSTASKSTGTDDRDGRSQATKDIPAVKAMLREAQQVLGYDLLQLCTDGPKEKLDDTTFAQVLSFVPTSLTQPHAAAM